MRQAARISVRLRCFRTHQKASRCNRVQGGHKFIRSTTFPTVPIPGKDDAWFKCCQFYDAEAQPPNLRGITPRYSVH